MKETMSSSEHEKCWNTFAYGKWTCFDGRKVIFNRKYQPIWERRPGEEVIAADPSEFVTDIDKSKSGYYWRNTMPYHEREVASIIALNEFNLRR